MALMLNETLEKVRKQWICQSLVPETVLSNDEIATIFSSLEVVPPLEAREVFSTLNGVCDDNMDGNCVAFWTLEKIAKENEPRARYIKFADFLIDSHFFEFEIGNSYIAPIFASYGQEDRDRVAKSFSEFFDLYLHDPSKLFI